MSPSVADSRAALRRSPDARFVTRDEFVAMLVSRRELIRADDEESRMRGLRDCRTGRCYLIPAESLPV